MKRFQNWAFILGVALLFSPACQGQVASGADSALTISGTVFDLAGSPDPGVVMSVTPALPERDVIPDVKSDANGKFIVSWQPIQIGGKAIPRARYFLVGRDLEHNFASTVGIDEKTRNIDLHLQAGLAISGFVQDDSGKPVETATLQISMSTPPVTSQFNQQPIPVDEQGAFTIGVLPQGQAYNLTVTAHGFGSASARLEAQQAQTASLRLPVFQLKRADRQLAGQVVGPDDKPVAGAFVSFSGTGQPQNGIVPSDANGHFVFRQVCDGEVHVSAILQPVPQAAHNGAPITPGPSQPLTGKTGAHGGDMNIVVKLASRRANLMGYSPTAAHDALEAACKKAAGESKAVFIKFGFPECAPCRVFDAYHSLPEVSGILGKYYVIVDVDTENMPDGKTIFTKYIKKPEGYPCWVILSAQGQAIVDSFAPEGNIGYPGPNDTAWYLAALKKATPAITEAELHTLALQIQKAAGK